MFKWLKSLFAKEEQKQVVDSGSVAIQYGGDIHVTTKSVDVPKPNDATRRAIADSYEGRTVKAASVNAMVNESMTKNRTAPVARKTPAPVYRNRAPHASAPRSAPRTSNTYVNNGPDLLDYAVMSAVLNDSSPSYSSPSSSSDSCSSSSYDSGSSSYDSGSSSSDSGSCGGSD